MVKHSTSSAEPDDRRRHTRHPVMWSGTLAADTPFDRYVLRCTIRNISISGVHVLVERTLDLDSEVSLRIDRLGEFKGRVVWNEGDKLGVQFEDAPDDVAALIRDNL